MTKGYTIDAYVTWRAGMELKHGRMIYGRGPIMEKQIVKLRYDGKYDFMAADVARQWTIMSHFIDANGQDRFKGSFSQKGLQEIGVLQVAKNGVK